MRFSRVRENFRTWATTSGDQRCVFIVGTGRSGTHLVAHVLASSPAYKVLVEKPPLFRWSAAMAADERCRAKLFPRWARRFQLEQFAAAPRVIVEKSHPNIWIIERLATAFPSSVFVGTRRGPHATVASMLKHGGFGWPEPRWRELPFPNRFLGIEPEFVEEYASMPLAAQLTMRWISNERRFDEVLGFLGPRLFEVDYEQLVERPQLVCKRLSSFLGPSVSLESPLMKTESIDRWRQDLTPEQVLAIDATLVRHGFGEACASTGVASRPRK